MKLFLFSLLVTSTAFATESAVDRNIPYRDADSPIAWKTAEPAEMLARGAWWNVFADPTLDDLEIRSLAANQDLQAAAARVEQARAAAGLARSDYWPHLAANGSVSRERTSSTTETVFPDSLTTVYRAPLSVSWELDLFGRVRHLTASARFDAEASVATFETVRLALTADVAENYFLLRALDHEQTLVGDGIVLRRRARQLAVSRFSNGTATELDVVRADTELATAEAEFSGLARRRAAVQNALAVLVGVPAQSFELPASTAGMSKLPPVPAELPASLLERRPDVAAAEHALAAANARIGVARAAFFPAISLTGGGGYASAEIDRLFSAGSRIWSIGPSLYLPIFQGGRNRANLERSRAAYDESVAHYRDRVLVAFREVQDALTATRHLAEQAAAQDRALTAARRAATLAQTRYDAGFVSFLDVIDAQRTSLTTERAAVQLSAIRMNTSVALIKALGGGWHAGQPSFEIVQR
jgi:multidrug efflux system outer membrane protein